MKGPNNRKILFELTRELNRMTNPKFNPDGHIKWKEQVKKHGPAKMMKKIASYALGLPYKP